MRQAARRQTAEQSFGERGESKLQRSPLRSLSLFAAAAAFTAAAACSCTYVCMCVFECALRAKLIFLFIKKKSKYICIFVCCAAFFFIWNIILVAAAKNIIYVLFMIFVAHWHFFICLFQRFLLLVFIETCLIYTQRHLGHTLGLGQRFVYSHSDSESF